MEGQLFLRGFIAAVFGSIIAWIVFTRYDSEIGEENAPSDRQRYLPYLPVYLLPTVLTVWAIAALVVYGWRHALEAIFALSFGILLQISLYNLILLAVLPLLRRRISARACALLWMTPNYLYITNYSLMELPMPRWVIPAPGSWLWALVVLWLAGVCLVLVWGILSHLRFRRQILKDAKPVTDPEILAVWQKELADACFKKPKFRLVVSPAVATPLSVGLFPNFTRVVLPHTDYDQEALTLILRHELIHIGRDDAMSKFFLLFCTALCWFNPLMWIARRKSAEDLELSCDETVLLQSEAQTRRRYADLLLTTAGDERGFTTCLSATASSLRYRLRQVVAPRKKRSGALLVGFLFFALCMSSGYVALAYGGGTGQELLLEQKGLTAEGLLSAKLYDGSSTTDTICADRQALANYLASLELRQLTGNYSFDVDEPEWTLLYETPDGTLAVVLGKNRVRILPFGQPVYTSWYYVPGGIDEEALEAILTPYPALSVTFIEPPGIIHQIHGTVYSLSEEQDGVLTPLLPEDAQEEDPSGFFGFEPDQLQLEFSRRLLSDVTVEIQALDGGNRYSLTLSPESGTLTPAPFSARYTVRADLDGINGSVYHAVFRFDVGET